MNNLYTISTNRKIKTFLLNFFIYLCVVFLIALLLFLIGTIFLRGLPGVTWEFLTTEQSFLKGTEGILPNILNTVYIILMTLIIVLPLGAGAAIYLTEYAKSKKAVGIIEYAVETLAGIPSIIYGLVGMLVFCEAFKLGTSLIAGALTLVIVTLPVVIRTTCESLKTVPQSYREGSLALGSGKWHMIRTVVLPSAVDGIVTGCILSIGRIVGESAALLFTAGMANKIFGIIDAVKPGKAGATLTVSMYMYAKERGKPDVAFAIAAILLIITLIINIAAYIAAKLLKKETQR